jgi:hypothetical protein
VTDLLKGLVAGGHRTLVFSQSRVMLDILQVNAVVLAVSCSKGCAAWLAMVE